MTRVQAAIAIGSNLGDRGGHVRRAVEGVGALRGTRVLAQGPVVETAAVGRPGVEAGGPYLNSAILVETSLLPRELLDGLHSIERAHGRDRAREERWGPRTLDLDILTYGNERIQEVGLTIPHPRMHERRFVLEPLAAIAPDLNVPGRGTVRDLLVALGRGLRSDAASRLTALAIMAGAAMACSAAALAQGPATPADVLRELQQTYRTSATCERIQVELRTPAPLPAQGLRASRSSIIARIQPVTAGTAPRAVGLELGQIHVWVEGGENAGRLVAVHDRDPASYFEGPLTGVLSPAAIGQILPPIPVPELDLAAAPVDGVCSEFWPYASGIAWKSVEPDAKQPGKRVVRGTFASGTVALTVQGGRLRTLVIDQPGKKVTLTLSFLPALPCEPAKAAISTAGRTRVASMEDLRPVSGTLRVGVRVPNMPITQGPAQGWDMGGLLQPPPDAITRGVRPAEHVVLVFLRDTPRQTGAAGERRFDPAVLAGLLRTLHDDCFKARMRAAQTGAAPGDDKDPGAAIAPFGYAPVLVLNAPKPEEILDRLAVEGKKWGPDVLWTTEPKATMDLFTPNSDASVVILDAEYVLRAVIPIEAAQTAEQAADQITAAMFELAPAEGK